MYTISKHSAWSFDSLLGRRISEPCKVLESSLLTLKTGGTVDPKGRIDKGSHFYDLLAQDPNFQVSVNTSLAKFYHSVASVSVDRYFAGRGEASGVLCTSITNSNDHAVNLQYMDTLPWFMKLYMSSFTSSLNDATLVTDYGLSTSESITRIMYQPAVDREKPSVLELELSVPAKSTFSFSFLFDKSLLRYTEYPPDAHRGFDVPYWLTSIS